MAGPDGALGAAFKIVRILQALSLIAIIGMAANFISQMVQHNNAPSDVLVGTLSVVSTPESVGSAIAWTKAKGRNLDLHSCAVLRHTYILYLDKTLPFLINTGMDGMLLIALIVVAVVVGKPLSYLNCQVIGSSSMSQSTYQLGLELKKSISNEGTKVQYSNWIGASRVTCYQMKAIWGLSIALW